MAGETRNDSQNAVSADLVESPLPRPKPPSDGWFADIRNRLETFLSGETDLIGGLADLATIIGTLLASVGALYAIVKFGLPPVRHSVHLFLAAQRRGSSIKRFQKTIRAKRSEDHEGTSKRLFVRLSLLVDTHTRGMERFEKKKESYQDLATIVRGDAEGITDENLDALVVLGEPGSGKSTLLKRLDLECAQAKLKDVAEVSWYVSLQTYHGTAGTAAPPPFEWLSEKWEGEWRRGEPHLPAFKDLLEKPFLLLLDALNEMPIPEGSSFDKLVSDWQIFILEMRRSFPKCKIVFSCRHLDYSSRLATKGQTFVPHVIIEKLNRETVREFLLHYIGSYGGILFDELETSGRLNLYNNAYLLTMLCAMVKGDDQEPSVPRDRTELFTRHIIELLREEADKAGQSKDRATKVLGDEGIIKHFRSGNDFFYAGGGYSLPDDGNFFEGLVAFAYDLQKGYLQSIDGSRLSALESEALPYFNDDPTRAKLARDLARSLSLLVLQEKAGADFEARVHFYHQLLQEYFAARRVASCPKAPLVDQPWRQGEVTPDLDVLRQHTDVNEPIPMPHRSGWHETFLLAAPMATDGEDFVNRIIESNLPLAGMSAASIIQSRIGRGDGCIPEEVAQELRYRLIDRIGDRAADLRARILAGLALGELGDPRLEAGPSLSNGAPEWLAPPMVEFLPSEHSLGAGGAERRHEHEGPAYRAMLCGFRLSIFPVSNAEWACFIRDGGYDNPEWWCTAAAEDWRSGTSTAQHADAQWRAFRRMLLENPGYVEDKLDAGELSPKAAEDHRNAMEKSDEEFESFLEESHLKRLRQGIANNRHVEPRRWRNAGFNNPLQPVVGICWYEALAYCTWLSSKTGKSWRIPSEVEWEAGARSGLPQNSPYAWGSDFGPDRCNSFLTHLRATSPIGVFPDAVSPSGLVDICGNALEWTTTRRDKKRYPYPWVENDGRDALDDDMTVTVSDYLPRVLKGGSWYYGENEARIAFRMPFSPGYHNQSTGLRLAQ